MTDSEAVTFQQWKGMDALSAFQLIDRRASDLTEIAAMMAAWFRVNADAEIAMAVADATRQTAPLSQNPPVGLLMSMALRLDHGFGRPGYYDAMFGPGEHRKRLACALAEMRKLYEEVSGYGFYKPAREAEYAAMMEGLVLASETAAERKPKRLRRSRAKGYRMPQGAVFVGRPTKWGNPYRVGSPEAPTNADAVALFRAYLERSPDLIEQAKRELRGKDLICWCGELEPCHADVWLEVANG
jgi:hypothetical protein